MSDAKEKLLQTEEVVQAVSGIIDPTDKSNVGETTEIVKQVTNTIPESWFNKVINGFKKLFHIK